MATEGTQQPTTPAAPDADSAGGGDDFALLNDIFGFDDADIGGTSSGGLAAWDPSAAGGEGAAGASAPSPSPSPTPAPSDPQPTPTATPAPTQAPQPDGQPAPTPAPAAQPSPTGADEVATLKAQVAALTQMLQQQQTQTPQQPTPTPTPAPAAGQSGTTGTDQPTEDDLATYQLGLPPDVAQAIFGDDPERAQQAMVFTINALARTIHTRIREDIEKRYIPRVLDQVGGTLQQREQQQQVQERAAQYFAAFPAHNTPAIHALINEENAALVAQTPQAAWDQNFINALGQRVQARLQALAGVQVAQVPAPAPTPTPAPAPARPAPFLPGQRSSAPAPGGSTGDEVVDILGWDGG